MELIDKTKLEAFGATCKSQDYINKINELVLEGYAVCFKFYPDSCVAIEVTYDYFYHANYKFARLDDIKPDCVVTILDCLKHKIEQQKEYWEKQNEII